MPREEENNEEVIKDPVLAEKRFVLLNMDNGVFLGEGKWSNVNPGWDNTAITYDELWANHFIVWFKEKQSLDVTKAEVTPDKDFGLISPEALAEQGLPSWEPATPPKNMRSK